MTLNRIAIDPGISGAIAWEGICGVSVCKMPSTLRDIWDLLESFKGLENIYCVIERVGGYMPGNSGPSAAKFAEHVGALKMALLGLKIPHDLVLPAKWEHAFIGKPNYDKIPKEIQGKARKNILAQRKRERKNKIKERAQQLYPDIKVTLVNADALGIMWYMSNA